MMKFIIRERQNGQMNQSKAKSEVLTIIIIDLVVETKTFERFDIISTHQIV